VWSKTMGGPRKVFLTAEGYPRVTLVNDAHKRLNKLVQNLVADVWIAKPMWAAIHTARLHHKNDDKLDNRVTNLEYMTWATTIHIGKKKPGGSSLFRGVAKHGKVWTARTTVARKYMHIGTYATEAEAARAVDAYTWLVYTDHAKLNAFLAPCRPTAASDARTSSPTLPASLRGLLTAAPAFPSAGLPTSPAASATP
jgi:hypothetical protein